MDLANVDVGSIEVEMQWFPRRQPSCVVVGVDKALAMLAECTGYFDEAGRFVNTFDEMEVWAVHDGSEAGYEGDPRNVTPVMKVRGRYRDFAILETPTLGALGRGSRVATNVYEVLKAARGKQVLFFPARFDAHEVQAADGYAYQIAVQLFNQNYGKSLSAYVSTDAQGDWWGGAGGGTVAHARHRLLPGRHRRGDHGLRGHASRRHPPDRPRRLPERLRGHVAPGHPDDVPPIPRAARRPEGPRRPRKYKLFGVRPDTSSNLRDVSVPPARRPRARLRRQPAARLPDARGHRPRVAGLAPRRRRRPRGWPSSTAGT